MGNPPGPIFGSLRSTRRLERLRIDIVGPANVYDGPLFQRTARWIAKLKAPWDGLLMTGIAGGLFGLAVGGSLVEAASGTWLPGSVAGLLAVVASAAASSHLSHFERVASAR